MLNNIDIKKLYDTGGKCKGLSALPSILKLGGACLILSVANFGLCCLYHRYKKQIELGINFIFVINFYLLDYLYEHY